MMKLHMRVSVFSFPFWLIRLVSVFLTKLSIGFPECFVSSVSVPDPTLNINSKKGISMPIETIEKMIDRTVKRKYKRI